MSTVRSVRRWAKPMAVMVVVFILVIQPAAAFQTPIPTEALSESTITPAASPSTENTSAISVDITAGDTTSDHHRFHVTESAGGGFAFVINGTKRQNLSLDRGDTYIFNVSTPGHPFHITRSSSGGNFSAIYTKGVNVTEPSSVENATETGVLTFTVPKDAPDALYYQCGVHVDMGAQLTIDNPTLVVNKSDASAFDSIQNAVDNATAGATIVVHSDVYNESVDVTKGVEIIGKAIQDGNGSGGPGAPSEAPVLDSESSRAIAFDIHDDVSDVHIEGFTVRNYRAGIQAWRNKTANVTVRHNTIEEVADGILVGSQGSRHPGWTIESNRVLNASITGISPYNTVNTSVRNNAIHRSARVTSPTEFSGGLTLVSDETTVENVTVRNNRITGTHDENTSVGIVLRSGSPLTGNAGGLANVTISDNNVSGEISGPGLFLGTLNGSTVTDVLIQSNVVRNATLDRAAMELAATDNGSLRRVIVDNNTLVANEQGLAVGFELGIGPATGTYSDIDLVGNEIANSTRHALRIAETATADDIDVHENQFSNNDVGGLLHLGAGNLNASHNYWGSPDGPGGQFNGTGDPVFGNVTVSPFYPDADFTTLATNISKTDIVVVNQSNPHTYNSIQNAVTDAREGMTIVVHSGLYNETVAVEKGVSIVSATVHRNNLSDSTGAPDPAPVLDSNGTRQDGFVIADNVSNLRIEGFAIRNYSSQGINAWSLEQGTANVTVRRNTIEDVSLGVLVGGEGSQNVNWTVESNHIVNASFDGIEFFLGHNRNLTIRNNTIDRSANLSDQQFASGISVTGTTEDVSIRNNHITGTYDNEENDGIAIVAGFSGQPVGGELRFVTGNISNVTVAENHIGGNISGFGIHLGSVNDSSVKQVSIGDNTVLNATNELPAINIGAVKQGDVESVTVKNNTLRGNQFGVGFGPIFQARPQPPGGTYDNITVVRNDITDSQQHGVVLTENVSGGDITVHENRILNNDRTGIRHVGNGTLNATHNYWGAPDGPSGDFNGSGDEVVGNVTIKPFYTDANLTRLSSDPTTCIADAVSGSDDEISLTEIQTAINWWAEGSEVPDTGGETISLSKVQSLINAWAEGTTVAC